MKLSFSSLFLQICLIFLASSSIAHSAVLPSFDITPTRPARYPTKTIDDRSIEKRGCFLQTNAGGLPVYSCTTGLPTVAQLVTTLQSYGLVGNKDSLFYAGLGSGAVEVANRWYCANILPNGGRGSVHWNNMVPSAWYSSQTTALYRGTNSFDLFQAFDENISQAFAEASTGTVYFFTFQRYNGMDFVNPDDTETGRTWKNFELPALIVNPNVEKIIQVDPTVDGDLGHQIWP